MIPRTQTSSQRSIDSRTPPLVYKIKQYKPRTMFQTLSYMLIRPPRFLYNQQLLIPPSKYSESFQIQEHLIPFKLSLYAVKNMRYVILYLHGNSSSRFQGYMHLKQLPDGVGLACFDFNGCGMRFDANFITLGYKQSKEVDIAAKFLKDKGYIVVGWGRSMGAVSLLLSSECNVMIADSPFCSLKELCQESSQKFLPKICCCFVKCFYPCVFSCVKTDLIQKAELNPDDLEVIKAIKDNEKNAERSLFLMAGSQDSMIPPIHSQKIFDAFPGKKKISIFDGTHNSNRPRAVIKQALLFAEQSLGLQPNPVLFYKQKSPRKIKPVKLIPISQPGITKINPLNAQKTQQQLMQTTKQQTSTTMLNNRQKSQLSE